MTKIIKGLFIALLFVMLAGMANAAVTVTMTTPTTGTTYNNLASNIRTIPITFTVTDNNIDVRDLNLTILYYPVSTLKESGNGTVVFEDVNVFDLNVGGTTGQTCTGNWTSFTCDFRWTLPDSVTLAEGAYFLDVNVMDVTLGPDWPGGSGEINADGNGTIRFTIDNHISTADQTRALMAIVGLILAGVVLLGGLGSIAFLKTDLTKTAIVTVVAAIAVAIGAMVIGVVLATL